MPTADENDLPEYQIEITDVADMEIESVYITWMRFGQKSADQWYAGLTKALENIAQFPRGFALAKDSDKLGGNVRQMIYGKGSAAYRILYRVIEPGDGDPGVVRIVRVRHAARRLIGEGDDD